MVPDPIEEDLENRRRADIEKQLAQYGEQKYLGVQVKRSIQALMQGYATADAAIILGYLFIAVPKYSGFLVFLWIIKNYNTNGRVQLAALAIGALLYFVWNNFSSKLWFRWASRSILPEEAKEFYSLNPTWLMGADMWEKLTSDQVVLNEEEE